MSGALKVGYNRKRCPDCEQELPLEKFPKSAGRKDGRGTYCLTCHNARTKKWKNKNPDKVRSNSAVQQERDRARAWGRHCRRYNLTPEDYMELLEEQGGVCAVCEGVNENGWRLSIDHDHSCCPGDTSCGECVRGLLCANCNRGIGSFHDDTLVMKKAIAYLEEQS